MVFTDEQIREELRKCPDPWAIAEHLVDQEVAAGEYEGCSSELEMAFSEYERRADLIKQAMEDTYACASCGASLFTNHDGSPEPICFECGRFNEV